MRHSQLSGNGNCKQTFTGRRRYGNFRPKADAHLEKRDWQFQSEMIKVCCHANKKAYKQQKSAYKCMMR
jgi:hypothetical protein